MAHKVKCAICGETFDLDTEQGVRHGARRYAHYKCDPKGELVPLKVSPADVEAQKKIQDLAYHWMGEMYNPPLIAKQINALVKDNNYTKENIERTLEYIINVKKLTCDKSHGGIGIVPYFYSDAMAYYHRIQTAQELNADRAINDIKVENITIPRPPRKIQKRKLFSFLDEDGE